ncbi:hypothetical protein LINPERPRIM_LOCUS2367 [Linum perenne]
MKERKILGISLSLILINMASIMERADENLLPSVYKEVSEAFDAGPSDLGYLTFIRNFVQGVASPLAGVLVINYDRPTILAIGTFCWAFSTAAVGASRHFLQVAFWRAINGFGLAIVIPALQSFIADSYGDGVRGAGFGLVSLIGNLGGIGGGVLATIMAGHEFWGVPGWRFAFVMMASLSSVIGLLVFMFVVDPRKAMVVANPRSVSESSASFDHNRTAALLSLFAFGCAMGGLVGGLIADRMSYLYPHFGRIICAQFSSFMGIPFSWFLLKVIPQSVDSYSIFAMTLFVMGLTISWNATAANGPMFAEVVPTKHRTMIYAFDRAFEVSFSSFAAPLVGILSEKTFGYDAKAIDPVKGSIREASALSKGLLSMMIVPFGLCCLSYTPLYKFFRQDKENARLTSAKEVQMSDKP